MEFNLFIDNFRKQFEDENFEVTPDTKFRSLEGWDSMTSLMVIAMFDETYNVVISSEELTKAETVEDLFNFIKK
jgi:acyl carrier protein